MGTKLAHLGTVALLTATLLVSAGCPDSSSGSDGSTDARAADRGGRDGRDDGPRTDGARDDGSGADGPARDTRADTGNPPDGALSDAAPTDGSAGDAKPSDGAVPDGGPPLDLSCEGLPQCPAEKGCGPVLTTPCCCDKALFVPSPDESCCCGFGVVKGNMLQCMPTEP